MANSLKNTFLFFLYFLDETLMPKCNTSHNTEKFQVWDTRQRICCNTFSAHEDYVSDLFFVSDTMQLLGTRYMLYTLFNFFPILHHFIFYISYFS